jgi:GTP-binding protein YchF
MGFNCGIVGLPNVGKSTLFNALTATAAAESANYPFCTIEPNVGRVGVPDERLDALAALAKSQKIIPTTLEFVDIAGLVKGASKGEGLGNQFLGHIRSVDAIIHVLRCFEDENITHVEGTVDPLRDKEIIETELMLADMENLEKRASNLQKKVKAREADAQTMLSVVEKVLKLLEAGTPARAYIPTEDECPLFDELQLLTAKPMLYVCNVQEDASGSGNAHTEKVKAMADNENAKMVIISANIEAEIAQLPEDEQKEFLETLGLQEKGLDRVIHEGYGLLDLLTFFTIGPKEARAWTVEKGSTAPQAAGKIHSDFERGFICADTIACDDFIACKGEHGAKEAGKLRQEGRGYKVHDGDVFHFKFNV